MIFLSSVALTKERSLFVDLFQKWVKWAREEESLPAWGSTCPWWQGSEFVMGMFKLLVTGGEYVWEKQLESCFLPFPSP